MPPRATTATLTALRRLVEDLGRTREVSVEGLAPDTAATLGYLEDSGRPFLAVTPAMRQTVYRYAVARLPAVLTRAGSVRVEAFWAGAGEAIKGVVLLRFREQGNDVPLAPLAPSTVYGKQHSSDPVVRGNATRIGLSTGDTYAALAAATFRVEPA